MATGSTFTIELDIQFSKIDVGNTIVKKTAFAAPVQYFRSTITTHLVTELFSCS